MKKNIFILMFVFLLNSCSTLNSTWDSISEAGDYLYDSVVFWEDEEPEQEQAIIIEEAVEVPEFAIPENRFNDQFGNEMLNNQQIDQPSLNNNYQNPYFDPVYRSARQYFYVTPNGTPMPAPPPPPFPQYSVEGQDRQIQSYGNNFNYNFDNKMNSFNQLYQQNPQDLQSGDNFLSQEEEMEIFAIQNDCIKVEIDYMNGGFRCSDMD
ncbi:MAG: hypothetical protein CMM96_05205 [Rickettsiales bacterium]|jgi:hypothetical protein|nr:hypothetical protein [Rickettsiales bacterium]